MSADPLPEALAGRYVIGAVIGIEPAPGSVCDADAPSVYQMPDGTVACRCVVCPRCGQHTGNAHQGHYWGWCKVTGTIRAGHFCCGNEFGCELDPPGAKP